MKALKAKKLITVLGMLMIAVIIAVPTISLAQPIVELGSANNFVILAGSTITNTGTTMIYGNVGLHPGSEFIGSVNTVEGEIHLADDVARVAKEDLLIAYNQLAILPALTIPSELGGTTVTPGVYESADTEFHITGTLTLDAQGDPNAIFIFKSGSSLITASNSNVDLINGAVFANVYWNVGSSATLGTNSHFEGNIIASESITVTTGSAVVGKLFAITGAVTLDSDTINDVEQPEAQLPVTGAMPVPLFYGLGALITAAGFMLIKRIK